MTTKNFAASVRARLLNHARETKRPFQEVLQYYAMERFLYRLSRSAHRERFILKGALMLRVWEAPASRPTRDVDLLGCVDNAVENLVQIVRELCEVEAEADGLRFEPASVSGAKIKEAADEGVRIRFLGLLENSQVPMQIDVASAIP